MNQTASSRGPICLRCLLRTTSPGTGRLVSCSASTPIVRPQHLTKRSSRQQLVNSNTKTPTPHPSTIGHATHSITTDTNNPSYKTAYNRPETHYDFFPTAIPHGPPPNGTFSVDLSALRREFHAIQASAHPDRHPEPSQKRRAEALSSRINDAYKTLQSPLLRAQYILSLNGIDVAEDETGKVEDEGLLMQVLDVREAIEDVREEAELQAMRDKNEAELERSVRVLEGAFEREDWEMARREAVRLRYWVNIRESIEGWEKGKPVRLQH